MSAHTPTPLEAKRVDMAHAVVYGSDGMVLARMSAHEHAFDRAVELARRCNSHDALVAALDEYGHHKPECQRLLGRYSPNTGGPHECTCGLDAVLATAKAAP